MNLNFSKFSVTGPIAALGLIVLVAAALYGGTLNHEFCNDDKLFIVSNVFIKHLNLTDVWEGFNTRFLAGLSFAVNYRLGGLNTAGYRLFNIFIHIINAFLVYQLVVLTFRSPAMADSKLRVQSRAVAFWAALILLAHPIQTEAVTYISQRITAMATMFYLGTILFYVKARLSKQPLYFIGSYLCLALGILTREMIITVPAAILVYEWLFFRPAKKEWPQLAKNFTPLILLLGVLLTIFQLDLPGSVLGLKKQLGVFGWEYFFTEINVLGTYLRLLVFPANQACDYQYPMARGLFQWPTLGIAIFLLAMLVFAFSQRTRRPLLSFCVFWFFIAVSVEFTVVCLVHRAALYEHWLYLAMVGFSILVPLILFEAVQPRRNAHLILLAIVTVLSILTVQRNHVWRTELALWQDVIDKMPDNYRAYAIIEVYYSRLGKLKEAHAAAVTALEYIDHFTDPQKAQLLINFGAIYGKAGDYKNEIKYNQLALSYKPDHPQAYSNIGYAYTLLGDLDKGRQFGEKATQVDPRFAEGHNNYGVNLAQRGEIKEALAHFERALYLDPDYEIARKNVQTAVEMLTSESDH